MEQLSLRTHISTKSVKPKPWGNLLILDMDCPAAFVYGVLKKE